MNGVEEVDTVGGRHVGHDGHENNGGAVSGSDGLGYHLAFCVRSCGRGTDRDPQHNGRGPGGRRTFFPRCGGRCCVSEASNFRSSRAARSGGGEPERHCPSRLEGPTAAESVSALDAAAAVRRRVLGRLAASVRPDTVEELERPAAADIPER